jgi:hypothetical protein
MRTVVGAAEGLFPGLLVKSVPECFPLAFPQCDFGGSLAGVEQPNMKPLGQP